MKNLSKRLFSVLAQYDAEYIVQAKFMRILSPAFVNFYEEKNHQYPSFILTSLCWSQSRAKSLRKEE